MTNKKTEIATIKNYSLDKPQEVVAMAVVLKNHIVKQNLYTNIKGKNYAHVDAWQFAGFLTGLNAVVDSVNDLSNDKEIKWQATVKVYSGDKLVSTGFAVCSNKEAIKKSFDEYAVLSMAQTRAIGKAYRNKLGWVMKLTGYESTPAEEMTGKSFTPETTSAPSQPTLLPGARVNELRGMLKGKNDIEKVADLKKRTDRVLKNLNITDSHAGILIAALLTKETK